jgi:hypothetical protein
MLQLAGSSWIATTAIPCACTSRAPYRDLDGNEIGFGVVG